MKTVRPFIFIGSFFAAIGCLAAYASTNHMVTQTDKTFDSKELAVAVGDTVLFKNTDSIKHNILVEELRYNSGIQQPGGESAVVFDQNGRFVVRCGIHSRMKMIVVVD
ncbi:plastocyanin/azurin family copper-binding protein [Pelagibius sp. Alg239-R121]|uniref:cupredoxin domain-containing protein n=1 Tax=Pelagibius sp. Alg239-R121 TaxID=2993448 RepID=UPI0024A7874E|nr:plastocyanin/azurin family copper-binding protein [Pelagibius sp. Alg239-R121]